MSSLTAGRAHRHRAAHVCHLIIRGKQAKWRMMIKSDQTARQRCKLDVVLLETSPRGVQHQDQELQKPTLTALTEHER